MTDRCIKLEVNDILCATEDVTAATTDEHLIPKGSTCRYMGLDVDGDFTVMVHNKRVVCFKEDLDHFDIR